MVNFLMMLGLVLSSSALSPSALRLDSSPVPNPQLPSSLGAKLTGPTSSAAFQLLRPSVLQPLKLRGGQPLPELRSDQDPGFSIPQDQGRGDDVLGNGNAVIEELVHQAWSLGVEGLGAEGVGAEELGSLSLGTDGLGADGLRAEGMAPGDLEAVGQGTDGVWAEGLRTEKFGVEGLGDGGFAAEGLGVETLSSSVSVEDGIAASKVDDRTGLDLLMPEETKDSVAQGIAHAGGQSRGMWPKGQRPKMLQRPIRISKLKVSKLLGAFNFGLKETALFRFLLSLAPIRRRVTADPDFLNKIIIELALGGTMQLAAEWSERGEMFFTHLDFVVADVISAMVSSVACCFFAAPVSDPHHRRFHWRWDRLEELIESCPNNAFEKDVPGQAPYTWLQRLVALLKPFPKLFAIGFSCSVIAYIVIWGFAIAAPSDSEDQKRSFDFKRIRTSFVGEEILRSFKDDAQEFEETESIKRKPEGKVPATARTLDTSGPGRKLIRQNTEVSVEPNQVLKRSSSIRDFTTISASPEKIATSPLKKYTRSLSTKRTLQRARSPEPDICRSNSPGVLTRGRSLTRSSTVILKFHGMGLRSSSTILNRSPSIQVGALARMHARTMVCHRSPTIVLQTPSVLKPSPSLVFLPPDFEDGAGTPISVILTVSAFCGLYLGLLSNLRSQFVAGVLEQRFLNWAFAEQPYLRNLGSALLRVGNYYAGSAVFFIVYRLFGFVAPEPGEMFDEEWGKSAKSV